MASNVPDLHILYHKKEFHVCALYDYLHHCYVLLWSPLKKLSKSIVKTLDVRLFQVVCAPVRCGKNFRLWHLYKNIQ
jgi:hypothetical protein